jgi:uncharacterized protein
MKLEQSFSVPAPIEQVWAALVDVERIAPCLPGAEITGVDESGAYEGTFSIKLGPTTAAYRGSLRMESVDEAARTATMSAKGTDKRGQGGASATIVSTMREEGDETHVDVSTDFHITGRLARFGRSGMIEDISNRLMRDFADCLQATIGAQPASGSAAASGGWLGAAVDATGAPVAGEGEPAPPPPPPAPEPDDADVADAAVASAGGAAAEAATAGSAPPGADDLATGPAAPAPPPPGEAPEPGAPGTGPLAGVRAPGDPHVAPSAGPETPSSEAAAGGPSDTGAPPVPQPAAPQPAERTGSIPPPSRADRPEAPAGQAAKPISGFSLFFSVLWERIKRVFSREKSK